LALAALSNEVDSLEDTSDLGICWIWRAGHNIQQPRS